MRELRVRVCERERDGLYYHPLVTSRMKPIGQVWGQNVGRFYYLTTFPMGFACWGTRKFLP